VIVIFFDRNGCACVPIGSYRKGDSWRQARASSRTTRPDKRTPSIGCVNEFAFVPLGASYSRELFRPPRPSGEENLIGAVVTGVAKRAVFLFRKLVVVSKPQPSAAVSGKDSPGR
jgi:hypothetical protein